MGVPKQETCPHCKIEGGGHRRLVCAGLLATAKQRAEEAERKLRTSGYLQAAIDTKDRQLHQLKRLRDTAQSDLATAQEALRVMLQDGVLCTDFEPSEEGDVLTQLVQVEDLTDEEYLTDDVPRVFRVPLKAWLAARAAL